jgi:hypothetical protein
MNKVSKKLACVIASVAISLLNTSSNGAALLQLEDFLNINPNLINLSIPSTFPNTNTKYKRWDRNDPNAIVDRYSDYFDTKATFKEGLATIRIGKNAESGKTNIGLSFENHTNSGFGCKKIMDSLIQKSGQAVISHYDVVDANLIHFITAETSFEKPSWRVSFHCFEIAPANQKDSEREATILTLLSGPKTEIPETMKRTLIKCDTTSKWVKGLTDQPNKKRIFYFYIDPGAKRLLKRDSAPVDGEVKEFTDQHIWIQKVDDDKNTDTQFFIDRVTGQIIIDYMQKIKESDRRFIGGADIVQNHSEGTCLPIEEKPKF